MQKCIAILALALASCRAQAATYDEAISAYSQNRVAEAETALRGLIASPTTSRLDVGRAYRELARITWLIDGDSVAALGHIAKSMTAGDGPCDSAKLRARILQESGQSAQLVAQADELANHCPGADGSVRLDALEAALDLASVEPADESRLVLATKLHSALSDDVRGSLEIAAASLELSLMTADAPAAVRAWKDYFWLANGDMPQGFRKVHAAATPIFEAGLKNGAPIEAQLVLIDLLVRAGFARAAQRFADKNRAGVRGRDHPLWRKASTYLESRRNLERLVLVSNRRVARGGKASDLSAAIREFTEALMRGASLQGDPATALRDAYGLFGQTGNTDGYASIHYGHAVQDERRTIEQYGHRAEVAFVALDNMISNGFNSWLWDGTAAAGGWAAPGPLIVQVRPEYISNPLSAWSIFNEGKERTKLLGRRDERALSDVQKLGSRDVAYLPGLQDRLRVQVADQIGTHIRSSPRAQADLRRAYLEAYWQATFQQSILSHEGRHALDKTLVTGLARLSDSNLEYRAKLSELALAEYPRLALININDSTVGGDSAHGKANVKVLKAYVEWLGENGRQVAGWDAMAPALTQIDKLTDSQIRFIARSLDPIAGKPR